MNSPDNKTPEQARDEDLNHLLNTGQTPVPEALSQHILEEARAEARLAVKRDALNRKRRHKQVRTGRWLATAASVVVVIALVPMMNKPKSQSPSEIMQEVLKEQPSAQTITAEQAAQMSMAAEGSLMRQSVEALEAEAPQVKAELTRSRAEQVETVSFSRLSESATQAQETAAVPQRIEDSPTAMADVADGLQDHDAPVALKSSRRAASPSRMTEDSAIAADTRIETAPDWEKRIRALWEDGQREEAQRQYRLLRKHYPDYKPAFNIRELGEPEEPD